MNVKPTTTVPPSEPPADTPGADPRMFLTAAEVGRELGIGSSRVYALAAAGLLPVFRLGRRIYFPRRGLEEFASAAISQARATADAGPTGARYGPR